MKGANAEYKFEDMNIIPLYAIYSYNADLNDKFYEIK